MPPGFIKESALFGPLFALGVFGVLGLAAAVVQVSLTVIIRHRMRTAPEALDTALLTTLRGPLVLFIALLGLFLGFVSLTGLTSPQFEALAGWDRWARKVWIVVVIAEVSYLVSHLTQAVLIWYLRAVAARTATALDAKLLAPVKRVLPLVIYIVGALVALDTLNISISPLLAGLGIGGLAVALALQPTLSNFFAGTYLVTEGELNTGDFIELEGGPSGYVVDVGWRSTKVRSRFNNLVIIPNAKMMDSIVTNYYSPTPAMNVIVTCGVSYDSDLVRVEQVVLEEANRVIAESPHAVKDVDPFFGFSEFGDSNIDFWVFFQATDRSGSFTLKSQVVKRIHARFKDEGIEINYPVRKLVSESSDDLPPGLRSLQAEAERAPDAADGG